MRKNPNSNLNRFSRFMRDVLLGMALGTFLFKCKLAFFKLLNLNFVPSPVRNRNAFLISVVLAPIVEELFFTKILYDSFKAAWQTVALIKSPVVGKISNFKSSEVSAFNKRQDRLHVLAILSNVNLMLRNAWFLMICASIVTAPQAAPMLYHPILFSGMNLFPLLSSHRRRTDRQVEHYKTKALQQSAGVVNAASALSCSLIFSNSHKASGRISAFIGNMCNSALYQNTGNITAPIARHMTNNYLAQSNISKSFLRYIM